MTVLEIAIPTVLVAVGMVTWIEHRKLNRRK